MCNINKRFFLLHKDCTNCVTLWTTHMNMLTRDINTLTFINCYTAAWNTYQSCFPVSRRFWTIMTKCQFDCVIFNKLVISANMIISLVGFYVLCERTMNYSSQVFWTCTPLMLSFEHDFVLCWFCVNMSFNYDDKFYWRFGFIQGRENAY